MAKSLDSPEKLDSDFLKAELRKHYISDFKETGLLNFRPVPGTKNLFRGSAPTSVDKKPKSKWALAAGLSFNASKLILRIVLEELNKNNIKKIIDLRTPDEIERSKLAVGASDGFTIILAPIDSWRSYKESEQNT